MLDQPFWQKLYWREQERTQAQALHLVAILQARGIRRVLDAAAGLGYRAAALAQAGFEVTACEAQPTAFETAATLIRVEHLPISLYRLGVSALHTVPGGPFDALLLLDDALARFEPHHQQRILERAHHLVHRQGLLVIGLRDWEHHYRRKETFIPHQVTRANGSRLLMFETWTYEEENAQCMRFFVRYRAGRWDVETEEVGYLPIRRATARQLFDATGWSLVEEVEMEAGFWWILQ